MQPRFLFSGRKNPFGTSLPDTRRTCSGFDVLTFSGDLVALLRVYYAECALDGAVARAPGFIVLDVSKNQPGI